MSNFYSVDPARMVTKVKAVSPKKTMKAGQSQTIAGVTRSVKAPKSSSRRSSKSL